MAESAIVVRGLRKTYAGRAAVDGVDLEVARGEIFALLGPNGAGKTTTVEILEGYRKRDGGDVSVLGADPASQTAAMRERIGIVLQGTGEFDELTVGEVVRHFARFYPHPDDPADVIERVGLTDKSRARTHTLSGGQKRRLDVALGIIGRPELLFLDEPTTGFDPEARREFWGLIRALQAGGTTIVLTTHYLEEAEALADRIAIMHEGRVAVSGSLTEIVAAQPAGFSATLPSSTPPGDGELPALRGTAERDGDVLRVRTDDLQGDLTAFLDWAAGRGVRLTDLRAAPASLADIYQGIRTEQQS